MSNDGDKIRITWTDVEKTPARAPVPPRSAGQPSGAAAPGSWGTIQGQAAGAVPGAQAGPGNILLKGWFYLGAAGLAGAFLAWAICEPTFHDGAAEDGWGNFLMFPVMAILMSAALGVVESLVERAWTRALIRGLAATGLGLVLGFLVDEVANFMYRQMLIQLVEVNPEYYGSPFHWVVRSIAWAVFGVCGGLTFGIVSLSPKKMGYGVLGGVLGAALGGLIFDPISIATEGGEASRAIGMSIFGASTGVAIGLVESALKDRWLYVSGGPLAGKQFVLYQDVVTIGRSTSSTIYLFKDPQVLDEHAVIRKQGGRSVMTANGPVVVSGLRLHPGMQHTLVNGQSLQVGRYTFTYAEKARAAQ